MSLEKMKQKIGTKVMVRTGKCERSTPLPPEQIGSLVDVFPDSVDYRLVEHRFVEHFVDIWFVELGGKEFRCRDPHVDALWCQPDAAEPAPVKPVEQPVDPVEQPVEPVKPVEQPVDPEAAKKAEEERQKQEAEKKLEEEAAKQAEEERQKQES